MHRMLIDQFGGACGLRDSQALESALARPQFPYCENHIQRAAALMESLAVNHPFVDGNNRIAFFAADTLLRKNGMMIDCDNDHTYQHFMALFDQSMFHRPQLESWLYTNTQPLKSQGPAS